MDAGVGTARGVVESGGSMGTGVVGKSDGLSCKIDFSGQFPGTAKEPWTGVKRGLGAGGGDGHRFVPTGPPTQSTMIPAADISNRRADPGCDRSGMANDKPAIAGASGAAVSITMAKRSAAIR